VRLFRTNQGIQEETVMTVADTQVLGELVDCADVAVRAAAQLQLFRLGREIRDRGVLERAVEFLVAAEGGGAFMSSGDSANLHATLRPLNWAVDARTSPSGDLLNAQPEEIDYAGFTEFLQNMRSTVTGVLEGNRPGDKVCDECIAFLDRLGETLGTRADQHMRVASLPS
jgi:hypothetical protein